MVYNNFTLGQPPKYGLCFDWETSGTSRVEGQHANEYQGLSAGFIVFDFQTYEPVDSLYVEIKFDGNRYKWSDGAQKIHGLSREHLEEHGVTQEQAACLVGELILKYFGTEKLWVCGHNVQFDLLFLDQLLRQFDIMPKVCHVLLDTSALGLVMLDRYRSDDIFNTLGLPPRECHNALEDAFYTLESARIIRTVFREALYGT